jgi:predicted TIM-barrel fold metal-dependent hydrolase
VRSTHRREFLQGAVALAAGLASGAARAASAPKKKGTSMPEDAAALPIIDTHQHLWDLDRFRLPWLEGAAALKRSYLPKDYADATAGLNVVKSVYMEVDVTPEQQVDEVEYILDLCRSRKTPTVATVISGRPGAVNFRPYIDRFKHAREIKGVRRILHSNETPPGTCLEPAFVRDIQYLGENGLRFDLCMRGTEVSDATRLVDQCPGTRFILDHCGNANVQWEAGDPNRTKWEHDVAQIAKRHNVVCKVSGIVATAKPGAWNADTLRPYVRHVMKEFGPDRVIFGGDWPVCTLAAQYGQWVGALKEIVHDLPVADQRKLFHDNANSFYEL